MPTRIEIPFSEVRSDFQGFTTLVNLAERLNSLEYSSVVLNMLSADWVDANMCAPLGAILYKASRNLNMVQFENMSQGVQRIFQKNGFLSYYGHAKKADTYGTTIQYQRFESKDDRFFGAYIEQHFKNKAIPDMSESLRKKFLESIFELFSNAVIHSETEQGIFTCGQNFPRKKHIDFAIADLGIGIHQTLINKKGLHTARYSKPSATASPSSGIAANNQAATVNGTSSRSTALTPRARRGFSAQFGRPVAQRLDPLRQCAESDQRMPAARLAQSPVQQYRTRHSSAVNISCPS